MKMLQLQEAKQQFSAVAEKAAGGEPQIVTKHGKPFVVIVSVADWRKSKAPERRLLEMLRACPVDLTELDLTRSRDFPRDFAPCSFYANNKEATTREQETFPLLYR
ncbi:MAG TPA: type II toxin-antitoxin system Phd/YefM family antitoxin [Verrucomicrobiota bacterium]|nr:type II toxin-antitoxin system Phd/YefM family antitoxin [Verrucomicrobiota bacterium]